MRAIALKCPNCSAQLRAQESATQASCTYCGTQARIQHRTRILERKVSLPPTKPTDRALPVAAQQHGVTWFALTSMLTLAATGGVAWYGFAKSRSATGQAANSIANAVAPTRTWISASQKRSFFLDVNDDAYPDIISRIRYTGSHSSDHLAAFDGRNGNKLWQSPALDAKDRGAGFLHAGIIVRSDDSGTLYGLSATDGRTRWAILLGEKLDSVCADSPSSLILGLDDKSVKRINLSDGALSLVEKIPEDCARVASDHFQDQRNLSKAAHSMWRVRTDIEGMKVSDALHFVDQPELAIGIGYKSPGTPITMVSVLKADPLESSKKKRKGRGSGLTMNHIWSAVVPALSVLDVDDYASDLHHIAATKNFIVVGYEPKNNEARVTCFSRSDGTRLWDVGLAKDNNISLIDVTSERAYATQWGVFTALDMQSGEVVFTLP